MVTSLSLWFLALPFLVVAQNYQNPVPTGYHLTLHIEDLDTSDTFNGSIEINVTLASTSQYISLDAVGLTVDEESVTVRRETLTGEWVPEPRYRGVRVLGERLLVEFSDPATATNYRLKMRYTGRYSSERRGFAKVPFHHNKKTEYIGVTSLEPMFARSVFPCFDDVSYRTDFRLEVNVKKNHTVISNVKPTNVLSVSNTVNVYHFKDYPVMPVHQLGWVVYDSNAYRHHTANASVTQVHTRAPYPQSVYAGWACNLTALLVDTYSNSLQLTYPLDKVEQVVVPEFSSEVTVGLGILSYPEESILFSRGQSSTRDVHKMALEISRGMAEQWFEGILSVKSWNSQWFSKGMAEYLKYNITATLPEMSGWELHEHMMVDLVQPALALDNSEHSLEVTSSNTSEVIVNSYSTATQYKGGAVIRMLQSILGNDLFDSSLNAYLKRSWFTSKQIDLALYYDFVYTYLSDVSANVPLAGQSIATIMEGWTATKGHPVVSVAWNGTNYTISQPPDSKLYVPITYTVQDSAEVQRGWLVPGTAGASLRVAAAAGSKWILVNVNQTGFYRVRYDATLRSLLLQQLTSDLSKIPRLSRAQLLDDVFSDLYQGVVTPESFLTFTSYLSQETDYFPWVTALRNFRQLLDTLYNKSSFTLMQNHLRDVLLKKMVEQVGMEARAGDTHTEKLRQALVLEHACALQHPSCTQRAVSILKSWLAGTYYDADLNMALLCAGVANSDSSTWHKVWAAYGDSKYPTVRAAILKALTCTTNATVLNAFLTNITSPSLSLLSSKDKNIVLQTLASTASGAELLLDWLLDTLSNQAEAATILPVDPAMLLTPDMNLPEAANSSEIEMFPGVPSVNTRRRRALDDREPLDEKDIMTILNYITPKLTTVEQGTKIEKFLKISREKLSQISSEIVLQMNQVTEQVYKNNEAAQKYSGPMTVWLSEKAAAASTSTVTPSTTPRAGPSGSGSTGKPEGPTAEPNKGSTTIHSGVLLTVTSLALLLTYKNL